MPSGQIIGPPPLQRRPVRVDSPPRSLKRSKAYITDSSRNPLGREMFVHPGTIERSGLPDHRDDYWRQFSAVCISPNTPEAAIRKVSSGRRSRSIACSSSLPNSTGLSSGSLRDRRDREKVNAAFDASCHQEGQE
jgi:hypothetical protein